MRVECGVGTVDLVAELETASERPGGVARKERGGRAAQKPKASCQLPFSLGPPCSLTYAYMPLL